MENYIEQIEIFLRGRMSQEEEGVFKTALASEDSLRLLAFVVAFILKVQKN